MPKCVEERDHGPAPGTRAPLHPSKLVFDHPKIARDLLVVIRLELDWVCPRGRWRGGLRIRWNRERDCRVLLPVLPPHRIHEHGCELEQFDAAEPRIKEAPGVAGFSFEQLSEVFEHFIWQIEELELGKERVLLR